MTRGINVQLLLALSRNKVRRSYTKTPAKRVYLGVKTCEVFICFVAIVRVRSIMLTSLFSLFYFTGECHRFLHRG